MGFIIADETSVMDLQLGYSLHPDGSDLTGSGEGDWLRSWVVIGTDTELGDPFFVDRSQPELPVYTAMHGVGSWDAELVSTSLESFLETLKYIKDISNQDSARIDPDENTIKDPNTLAEIEERLCSISGVKEYWQGLIEQHQAWINEFGS